LFLYSYGTDFIQGLLTKNEKKLTRSFHFTFRYIDDVLSINNYRFGDFDDRIYPIVVEIKDARETRGSVFSLLVATLSQGYSKRYYKLCNILSTERYILHIQVLLKCCYTTCTTSGADADYCSRAPEFTHEF
jgi:hypothetical protein